MKQLIKRFCTNRFLNQLQKELEFENSFQIFDADISYFIEKNKYEFHIEDDYYYLEKRHKNGFSTSLQFQLFEKELNFDYDDFEEEISDAEITSSDDDDKLKDADESDENTQSEESEIESSDEEEEKQLDEQSKQIFEQQFPKFYRSLFKQILDKKMFLKIEVQNIATDKILVIKSILGYKNFQIMDFGTQKDEKYQDLMIFSQLDEKIQKGFLDFMEKTLKINEPLLLNIFRLGIELDKQHYKQFLKDTIQFLK